jgi:hypothetical protein
MCVEKKKTHMFFLHVLNLSLTEGFNFFSINLLKEKIYRDLHFKVYDLINSNTLACNKKVEPIHVNLLYMI